MIMRDNGEVMTESEDDSDGVPSWLMLVMMMEWYTP